MKLDFIQRQRSVWQKATTSFSSIHLKSSSDYLTGGTQTLAVNSWKSQAVKKEQTPSGMGISKKNAKVMVIMGYHYACNSGDGSAWRQGKIFM
jgi:hypothetical protein